MATLNITRSYQDGNVLFQDDLDALADSIEAFANTTKLNDDNLQDGGITGSTKLADASVSEVKIAASAVTSSKIADANVTTVKIADANITTAKILDANVTTVKIADANITTAKLADASVTAAKIEAVTDAISSSSGSLTNASASFVDATGLSVTLTTTGRPVEFRLQHDGGSNAGYIGNANSASGSYFKVFRDSTLVAFVELAAGGSASIAPPSIVSGVDRSPSAGSHTYKVQFASTNSNAATILNTVLYVREMH